MICYVINQARPRLALDVGTDAMFLDHPKLSQTRSELVLPLIARNRVIGTLDLQSDEQKAFSEADTEILQTLADQLATAIENARLFSERESVIEQFEAVTALQVPKTWGKFLQERNPAAYQYTRTGIQAGATSSLGNNSKTLRLPLVLRGREIGAVTLGRREAGPDWYARDRDMAQEIISQVVLALENARLLEETTRRAEMERVTSEITTRINTSTLYESIIQTAAEELSRALGGSEVLVQLQRFESGEESGKTEIERGQVE
jgi:GAF domain-containing protein